ncbi:MAG: DUF3164 family protein [Rhodobacter sp.]|nr:DUF3164 family protein [Rhodobacter sp.]
MTELNFTPVPDRTVEVGGKVYMATAKGGLQPVETIKPQHLLEDEVVRKITGYALVTQRWAGRRATRPCRAMTG